MYNYFSCLCEKRQNMYDFKRTLHLVNTVEYLLVVISIILLWFTRIGSYLTLRDVLCVLATYLGVRWRYMYQGCPGSEVPKDWSLPPGPRPYPVVGNLLQLGLVPFKAMTKLAHTYGEIYRVKFGSRDVIIINGHNTLKETFVMPTLQNRPDLTIAAIMGKGKSLTFNGMSEGWNVHKKCASKALHQLMRSGDVHVREVVESSTEWLCRTMLDTSAERGLVQPRDLCKRAVNRTMLTCCFGHSVDLNSTCSYIENTLDDFGRIFPLLMAADFIPWTRLLFVCLRRRTKRVMDVFNDYMSKLAHGSVRSDDTNHIVGMLKSQYADQGPGRLTSLGLTEEQVLLTVEDLIGAGQDTTGSFLQWAILYLAKFPDVQAKLYEEVNAIHDGRMDCAYVKAFNWEVCRHASVSANSVPHSASGDTILKGFLIPKGSIIIGNMHSVFYDETVFENPEEFRPGRFIDGDGGFRSDLLQYVPMFGLGKRRCLGEPLAKFIMQMSTIGIVRRCKISEDPKNPLVLGKGVFTLIFAPYTYEVIVEPRC